MIATEEPLSETGTAQIAHVLLDESGQQLQDRPVLVGGAICYNLVGLEGQIRDLWEDAISTRRIQGTSSFDALVREGFHNGQIPLEISQRFIDSLTRIDGFRMFITLSRRARLPKLSDDQRCLVLYSTLLRDLIPHIRAPKVRLLFEQNDSLNRHFPIVAKDAIERIRVRSPRREPPEVKTEIVTKQQYSTLGVIDFALSIVSHWVVAGAVRDNKAWQYRNFLAIERDLAIIYDFDSGLRSTRESRDFH